MSKTTCDGSTETVFALSMPNAKFCPRGYAPIDTEDECKQAALDTMPRLDPLVSIETSQGEGTTCFLCENCWHGENQGE